MILATWLSQAAIEEQTSVLHIILRVHIFSETELLHIYYLTCISSTEWTHLQVLCHLPLHKSLPAHMSAILQSVNKLRFYRGPGVFLLGIVDLLRFFSCMWLCMGCWVQQNLNFIWDRVSLTEILIFFPVRHQALNIHSFLFGCIFFFCYDLCYFYCLCFYKSHSYGNVLYMI